MNERFNGSLIYQPNELDMWEYSVVSSDSHVEASAGRAWAVRTAITKNGSSSGSVEFFKLLRSQRFWYSWFFLLVPPKRWEIQSRTTVFMSPSTLCKLSFFSKRFVAVSSSSDCSSSTHLRASLLSPYFSTPKPVFSSHTGSSGTHLRSESQRRSAFTAHGLNSSRPNSPFGVVAGLGGVTTTILAAASMCRPFAFQFLLNSHIWYWQKPIYAACYPPPSLHSNSLSTDQKQTCRIKSPRVQSWSWWPPKVLSGQQFS